MVYTLLKGALGGAFSQDDYADFYLEKCPNISVYLSSAITALLFQVLHVALMVLTFFAFKSQDLGKWQFRVFVKAYTDVFVGWRYAQLVFVFLLHLSTSLVSVVNDTVESGRFLKVVS